MSVSRSEAGCNPLSADICVEQQQLCSKTYNSFSFIKKQSQKHYLRHALFTSCPLAHYMWNIFIHRLVGCEACNRVTLMLTPTTHPMKWSNQSFKDVKVLISITNKSTRNPEITKVKAPQWRRIFDYLQKGLLKSICQSFIHTVSFHNSESRDKSEMLLEYSTERGKNSIIE